MRALKRVMFAAVIMAGIAVTATPGFAQVPEKFPTKPIRLVVGLAPGGTLDTLARITGQKMTENDPLKDFAGVTQFGYGTGVLVVAPALGVKTLKELIALAQDKPGQVLAATIGAGSANHLGMERIRLAAGIKLGYVAFRSGPDAVIQVVGGHVHFTLQSLISTFPFIKDGKVLALGFYIEPTTPEEYDRILRRQIESLSKVARDVGLRPK